MNSSLSYYIFSNNHLLLKGYSFGSANGSLSFYSDSFMIKSSTKNVPPLQRIVNFIYSLFFTVISVIFIIDSPAVHHKTYRESISYVSSQKLHSWNFL
jgi:hypothetical protein